MARAALRWNAERMAKESKLAKNTVLAFETGHGVRASSILRIQTVFEKRGLSFDGLTITVPKTLT